MPMFQINSFLLTSKENITRVAYALAYMFVSNVTGLNLFQIVVGGGIVEKKLLMSNPNDNNYAEEEIESRGLNYYTQTILKFTV